MNQLFPQEQTRQSDSSHFDAGPQYGPSSSRAPRKSRCGTTRLSSAWRCGLTGEVYNRYVQPQSGRVPGRGGRRPTVRLHLKEIVSSSGKAGTAPLYRHS